MKIEYRIPIDFSREKKRVTVVGCGRWGSFLAWYADQLGHNVTVYGIAGDPTYENFVMTRKNEYVKFAPSIELTSDIVRAVKGAEIVVVSVPSDRKSVV